MHSDSQQEAFSRATELYNHRQFPQCADVLSQCVKQAPSSMGFNNLGVTLYRAGMHEQAFKNLKNSLSMDHLNFVAHFNLFSLFSLKEQSKLALESLVRGVSSLNTLKCREEDIERYCQRAILLCRNNKEAMALQGMFYIKRNQIKETTDILRKALKFESDNENRKGLKQILSSLEGLPYQGIEGQKQKNISGSQFQLECSIDINDSSTHQKLTKDLLKQFNCLYWSLSSDSSDLFSNSDLKQKMSSFIDFTSLARKENKQLSVLSNQQSLNSGVINISENKFQEETNQATTHNSMVGSESLILQQKSHFEKQTQRNTQNTITPELQSLVCETTEKKKKQVFINFTVYYGELNVDEQVYVTLNYYSEKNNCFVTSLSSKQNQYHIWNEVSKQFELSPSPSCLSLKVYRKDYSRFRDQLVGQSIIQLEQLGAATVPLLDLRNRKTGQLYLGVALQQ